MLIIYDKINSMAAKKTYQPKAKKSQVIFNIFSFLFLLSIVAILT